MRRTAGVGIVLVLASAWLVLAAPAMARTRGKERLRGVVIATNQGGQRTVVSGWATFRGVLNATARIVEVANRPGDPDNVSRDNLVFARGTMRLVTTNRSFTPSVNPQTCANTVRIRQTAKVRGGTGAFRHASGRFTGILRGRGVTARNPDGSCSQQLAELLEVASFSMSGTLSL
jgi:hypothetical protein